jgi:hypothetical protein
LFRRKLKDIGVQERRNLVLTRLADSFTSAQLEHADHRGARCIREAST